MLQGVLIPIIVEGIKSLKDGSISLNITTQELPPSNFSERQVEDQEKKVVDSLDPELKGKTAGQRLRGTLYRLWEQENEGYKDSDSFYKYKMEQIITHYKSKLQP